jgi:hypothetical protein
MWSPTERKGKAGTVWYEPSPGTAVEVQVQALERQTGIKEQLDVGPYLWVWLLRVFPPPSFHLFFFLHHTPLSSSRAVGRVESCLLFIYYDYYHAPRKAVEGLCYHPWSI